MSLSALFPSGKKKFLHDLCCNIASFFISSKPLVILEAYTPFHLEHFKHVIHLLSEMDEYNIVVITPNCKGLNELKNVRAYKTINEYPIYKKADVFISTDYNKIPHWFSCPTIYFGHGIGPKLDYVARDELLAFDFVFSPYRPAYELQIQTLPKERVIPVGLPILEDKSSRQQEIIEFYQFDGNKPLIVYAPSWCSNITKISDIKTILALLSTKKQFNIVVSPHPLLFDKNRCKGEDFFKNNNKIDNLNINTPESQFTTLELVKACDIVISDISSILFEAMALKKNVLLDGNKTIYEHCNALKIYDEIIKFCPVPCWNNNEDLTIEHALELDTLCTQRELFINNYLFNSGDASKVFIQQLSEIIKHG
jgi:hypothetical protein